MRKTLAFVIYLGMFSSAYAADEVQAIVDREATQINVKTPEVNEPQLKLDQLRKQELSAQTENKNQSEIKYTARQLIEQPEILEDLFVSALVNANKAILPTYIKLYQLVPSADTSLIDWANAILLRDTNLNDSVNMYRKLLSSFPNNEYVRFQLAETLFYNQEYEAAKTQFERLRATENISENDIVVFDRFIDAINNKDSWNFSFGATFLNDKNLANSAKQGTKMALENGGVITYNSARQEGQGISAWFSADKQWMLSDGKYTKLETGLSGKYYWDNKRYNDINTNIGFGLGYADARFNIELIPYISKRWYAGGMNSGESLKQYSNTYGANLSLSYWLNQNFKYSLYYDYGYDKYEHSKYDQIYSGPAHALSNSLMYMPSATQYWSLALDLHKKDAKDRTNAYERIGGRLIWGQEWPLGLSTQASVGIGKRNYKEGSFLGKQKNKELSTSLSVWHKELHYQGFTPRITWSYTKTNSNLAIYSYDKHQIFFDVSKSF
ncbi:surface lipoprotein assembly modifier [Actinobacillus genomosp. 2]|uniref:surface lipoprotein assembly modifier n=1 Tax=Actinobacillus genomosp. 2 TaxID=230709 RepID=UPI002442D33D|nr:surface lipoprotein assembly modifier [Actinobacillus genomosp. 2]WGE32672.1 surface lipoprotein assembly modifier [Actinobacillus genomosp. 2]